METQASHDLLSIWNQQKRQAPGWWTSQLSWAGLDGREAPPYLRIVDRLYDVDFVFLRCYRSLTLGSTWILLFTHFPPGFCDRVVCPSKLKPANWLTHKISERTARNRQRCTSRSPTLVLPNKGANPAPIHRPHKNVNPHPVFTECSADLIPDFNVVTRTPARDTIVCNLRVTLKLMQRLRVVDIESGV